MNVGAIARVGDLAARLRELIDAKRGADIGGRFRLGVLDGNSGRVRHPIQGADRDG